MLNSNNNNTKTFANSKMQSLLSGGNSVFDGTKWKYATWRKNLVNALSASQGNMILNNTYKLKVEPKRFTKAQQPDDSLREERKQKIEEIRENNKVYLKSNAESMKILNERLSQDILPLIYDAGGSLKKCVEILDENYGDAAMTSADRNVAENALKCLTMAEKGLFKTFSIWFQTLSTAAGKTDEQALDILLSRSGVNLLPSRFDSDIIYCRKQKLDLKNSLEYLQNSDNIYHEDNDFKTSSNFDNEDFDGNVKRAKRARANESNNSNTNVVSSKDSNANIHCDPNITIACWNCQNYGHYTRDCKTNACSYCKKWDCGHSSQTCPVRLEARKNKANKSKDKDKKSKKKAQRILIDPEYSDDDDDEHHDILNSIGIYRIKIKKTSVIHNPKVNDNRLFNQPKKPLFGRLDSGADATIINSKEFLNDTHQLYNNTSIPKIEIATGDEINCVAKGSINKFLITFWFALKLKKI